MVHEELNRARKIVFVNPAHKLAAAALLSAKTESHQVTHDRERVARSRAKDNGRAHGDLARSRCGGAKELRFPILRHLDREIPRLRRAPLLRNHFVAAQLPRRFIHGAVQRMPVDGGRRCVEPYGGRRVEPGNYMIQQPRDVYKRQLQV